MLGIPSLPVALQLQCLWSDSSFLAAVTLLAALLHYQITAYSLSNCLILHFVPGFAAIAPLIFVGIKPIS
jgi:hypothetical protein